MFSLIFLAAFEAMAVTTVMPLVARDLDLDEERHEVIAFEVAALQRLDHPVRLTDGPAVVSELWVRAQTGRMVVGERSGRDEVEADVAAIQAGNPEAKARATIVTPFSSGPDAAYSANAVNSITCGQATTNISARMAHTR